MAFPSDILSASIFYRDILSVAITRFFAQLFFLHYFHTQLKYYLVRELYPKYSTLFHSSV